MRKIKEIKITAESIKKNRWDIVKQLSKIHKRGIVLDVLELEGSYALENSAELFEVLSAGEQLTVCESDDAPNKDMLSVKNDEGKTIGFLPISISGLPRFMLKKGCLILCYIENKDFTNNLLTVCVSMYVNNY